MKKQTLKKNGIKGITLIALVITIIVLLILAGVSIVTLRGENGLLTRADAAKNKNKKMELKEIIELQLVDKKINAQTGIREVNLKEKLEEIEGATVEEKIDNEVYYIVKDEYDYTVYENGDIYEGEIDIWDGESVETPKVDNDGNWHIYTCAQLKFLEEFVNGTLAETSELTITESTIIYLEENLDLGARQVDGEKNIGTEWIPIGKDDEHKLLGDFEGNNHMVKGLYSTTGGLFGVTSEISNLTIKDGYLNGVTETGAFSIQSGTIMNCHNDNTTVKRKRSCKWNILLLY